MGKKALAPSKHRGKGKKEVKELDVKSRTAIINLHRRTHKCTFKKKAPTAVKQIKEHARKTMYTKDVRIDTALNQHIWRNGVRNLDRKVEVVMERKKNDQEDAKHKMYTLVRLA
jgi:large subunit ribosomal protein L31e